MKQLHRITTYIFVGAVIIALGLVIAVGGFKINRWYDWTFGYHDEVEKLVKPLEERITALERQGQQYWKFIERGDSLPSNVPRMGYLFFLTSDSTLYVSTGIKWEQIRYDKLQISK